MKKRTIQNIEAEVALLNSLLAAERLRKERTKNSAMVGRCFRYMNTYGASDHMCRWPLYIRIDRMGRDAWLHGISFQRTSRNKVDFDLAHFCGHVCHENGYEEISRAEFNRALRGIKATISAL